jgi:acyl-CoA thioesterase
MKLIDYLNRNDRFAAAAGVQLVEIGEGYARAVMTVTENHVNGANVCQGGAIFTLADLAFAAAVNSGGLMTVGTSNSITYLHSAHVGDILTAEARQEDHHKMPFCETRVTNQDGVLICVMTGSAYRRQQPLFED